MLVPKFWDMLVPSHHNASTVYLQTWSHIILVALVFLCHIFLQLPSFHLLPLPSTSFHFPIFSICQDVPRYAKICPAKIVLCAVQGCHCDDANVRISKAQEQLLFTHSDVQCANSVSFWTNLQCKHKEEHSIRHKTMPNQFNPNHPNSLEKMLPSLTVC